MQFEFGIDEPSELFGVIHFENEGVAYSGKSGIITSRNILPVDIYNTVEPFREGFLSIQLNMITAYE
jgi:hypothetical protein